MYARDYRLQRRGHCAISIALVLLSVFFGKLHRLYAQHTSLRSSEIYSKIRLQKLARNSIHHQNRLRAILEAKLSSDAAHEWSGMRSGTIKSSTSDATAHHCTDLLQAYGLCEPALLQVPGWHELYRGSAASDRAFVFLHFSKCAGTSLIKSLAYLGYAHFSATLPSVLSTDAACSGESQKCCWWGERLRKLHDSGRHLKVLEQEPANTVRWIDLDRVNQTIDPGFDADTDICPDLAYATVLRKPVERLHSHMCEIGANFSMWFTPDVSKPGHVSTQLRDNYFVRSLGGPDAWNAPEGGLRQEHLLSAARTLAPFDVVMTVDTLARDAHAQMGRVGLPNFRWPHLLERSRAENLRRAEKQWWLRTGDYASCEVPPSAEHLKQLVAACTWDAMLYEFAQILAMHRSMDASQD